ncbi:hypothetical protein EPD60_05950 [Flaviaesturariibacter flavus]|uniref:T9SS type B sorting domain-containing protein n=1 Tax=Flaviaesturariibacter flavus TaxID=2502780 RepID=A0A4R1BKI2_9BACT|nr:gliding motility-associated C-terminal domain-containing protein [Flaviaesturariibacter flavus]TCJ17728.1 hypothetical protein EPD60_05950 [Flaviaesturariibacter flavus]
MRKRLPALLTRGLFMMLALLGSVAEMQAQVDITIGTGTAANTSSTYPTPLQDFYEGSRAQYLYRASELQAAGMVPGFISAIKFNVVGLNTSTASYAPIENLTFKIGTTTANTLNPGQWEPVTQVWTTGVPGYTPTMGLNTFTFTPSGFFWNGTDNIVVESCNGDPAGITGTTWTNNTQVAWTTGLPFVASHLYRADAEGNLCGTASVTPPGFSDDPNARPNIVFVYTPATACSGTPTPGTTVATPAAVCLGESFTLSVTGSTVASGLTYQWQSAPAASGPWTNIAGATSPVLTTTQSVTTFYRRVITCSGNSAESTPVQVQSPTLVCGTFRIGNTALGANFATLNDAYNYIKCGISCPVVFNVDPGYGPLNEQLIMNPVPGASAVNTVTWNGNGASINFTSSNSNERAVIKLNGADHITFNNFVINVGGTTTTNYGYGVQLLNDADSNTVNNCTINVNITSNSTQYGGIIMSASASGPTTTGSTLSDGNVFSNNTINGGYYGITLVGSSTEAVRQNSVIRNNIKDFYLYGIYLTGNFNTVIDSNTFSRPNRLSANISDFYGVYGTALSTQVMISRNTFTNPFGAAAASTNTFYGVYFTSTDALGGLENKVYNNLIWNLTGSGNVYGFYNAGSDNIWYHHNTIVLDGSPATSSATNLARAFYQTTIAAGIEFKNNIVAITRNGSSTKHAIYMNTPTSSIVSDHNDFYINAPGGANYVGFLNANQQTLANWQAASLQDAGSIVANPVFTDPTNGNFKPTSPSVNNLGEPLGYTDDIVGTPRNPLTPDMGAWEFEPAACTAPPVPGTTVITPASVCEGFPVQLTAAGASTGLTQTYQWQSSTTLGGTYTNIGNVLSTPDTTITAAASLFYRVAVTCSGITSYSTPMQLNVNLRLPGGTYTLGAGGTYPTFAAAKAAMACGIAGPVVFNVTAASTTFNEQLILDSIPGTSAVNTVTFNGNGKTLTYLSTNTNERATLKFNGADHVIFNNLIITAQGTATTEYGYGVQFINGSDSNRVFNCTINVATNNSSTNFTGIAMNASASSATTTGATNCDANVVDSCTINGGYYGMTMVGGSGTPVTYNVASRNTFRNFYLYGIYVSYSENMTIEANDISRPSNTTLTTFYGVYALNPTKASKITRNRIHNNSDALTTSGSAAYGMYLSGFDSPVGSETYVSNNAIYNINSNSDIYGIYNTGSDNIRIVHNTISLDNQGSTYSSADWTRGYNQTGNPGGVVFRNNMITITRTGNGTRYGIYVTEVPTDFVSNNNDIYVNKGASGGEAAVGYNGSAQVTLANWRAATGLDLNSFSLDPLYTAPNATPADFTPRMPPLDNQGAPVGVLVDINNQGRSATTPDIGAFEFAIPPCTAPPTPGTAVVTPNTGICMGTPLQLTLTGHSSGAGQTYQWQTSPTNGSGATWTNLGDPMMFPDTTVFATTTLYYRAALTCSGQTSFSAAQLVTLNPALLNGVYTVGAAPSDYPNLSTAIAALECGVTGPVTFMVKPGTYNEQLRMHAVAGTGPNVQVTFRAQTGDPASVIVTFAGTATRNYTLQLDSASYVTWMNMTITNTSSTNGRVIEMANSAANDSLYNLVINPQVTTSTGTTVVGIYAANLRGGNNLIKKNTITNGTYGIYFQGNSTTTTRNNRVDSNTVNNSYSYGIYAANMWSTRVTANTVSRVAPMAATSYGIYLSNVDSVYQVAYNKIDVSGSTGTAYGLYLTGCDANFVDSARVMSNTISMNNGMTGGVYGMYQSTSNNNFTINNVISVATTNATSYGLYSTSGGNNRYWNNTVNNFSATGTSSDAAYFANSAAPVDIRNNVFAHQGVGRALEITNTNGIYSDYNMLYTAGTVLVRQGTINYATLDAWVTAAYWDLNSIVYKPGFVSNTDLHPNLTAADVWAMHGRGTQIAGNNFDFAGSFRPTTLREGVPDLGAYEFLPTVAPPALTAIPATPAAGSTQTFMFGTDTVAKVTYAPGTTVPTTATLRRYSGVLPAGIDQVTNRSMYFYNQVEITGSQPANYKLQQFYIDPWQGFIGSEDSIRLGRTNAANTWITELRSTVNPVLNYMQRDSLNFMDRFTGLTNGQVIMPPPANYAPQIDSSNRGKRFWVAYQRSYDFFASSNSQNMVLYLSTDNQAANVTVKIKGTTWVRTYAIPANTAISTEIIPKSGLIDARLLQEGLYGKGISIEADVPITAYAHIYSSTNSGATMLLPVGTYGFEYYTLNSQQDYTSSDAYSSFFVIADRDNTKVQITPSKPTLGGRPAGVPFEVVLNAGDVYQVLGAMISGTVGYDLTGSTVRSVPNSDGKCWPMAVFAGSTRTGISCGNGAGGSGDVIIQQVFPYQAWGTRYLTAPTSNGTAASSLMTNIYRVMVKDPATQVFVNNTLLTSPVLINGTARYYQIESNTADVITANKPIMVAQYMASSGLCGNTSGDGDPEMFYLSPVQQAVKYAGFYRNNLSAIDENYLTIVIPTGGLPTLKLDGQLHSAGAFDYTYPHPNMPGYSVVVKRWGAGNGQNVVQSDSAFTGIVYGLGSVESYGYNVGTLVKNLNGIPAISNTLSTSTTPSSFTCVGSPFQFRIQVPLKPVSIKWQFSAVPVMSPNSDVIQNNPVPTDSTLINGQMYYTYTVTANYTVSTPGTFLVPISFTHPEIEGCNSTLETTYPLNVVATPKVDFTTASFTVCPNNPVTFTGAATTVNGTAINTWSWNINTTPPATGSAQNLTTTFANPGTYNVTFKAVTVDGCVADTTKQITVAPTTAVNVVADTVGVCAGNPVVFNVQGPVTGITYNWYDAATGGTLLSSGTSFSAPNTIGTVNYYVEATNGTCVSARHRVTAIISAIPTVTVVNANVPVCQGNQATFTIASPVTGVTYNWYAVATGGTPVASGTTYTAPSVAGSQTFYVAATINGCTSARQTVTTFQTVIPAFTLVRDTIGICQGSTATFTVSNPAAGVTYNWYSAATGGTLAGTGTNFNAPSAPGTVSYFVEATQNGCVTNPRKQVVVRLSVPLATPVASADSITQNSILFRWNAVAGATAYEVSTNNGGTWSTPTSGSLGLTHRVNNLTPAQTVTLLVRAIGSNSCETSANGTVTATTQVGVWYIPTAFSPGASANGPAENDQLRIYPNSNTGIASLRFMVFNQWGGKVAESTDPRMLWDGTYKGKAQPSGVYMYVCHIVMQDGRVFDLKGSVNLIR